MTQLLDTEKLERRKQSKLFLGYATQNWNAVMALANEDCFAQAHEFTQRFLHDALQGYLALFHERKYDNLQDAMDVFLQEHQKTSLVPQKLVQKLFEQINQPLDYFTDAHKVTEFHRLFDGCGEMKWRLERLAQQKIKSDLLTEQDHLQKRKHQKSIIIRASLLIVIFLLWFGFYYTSYRQEMKINTFYTQAQWFWITPDRTSFSEPASSRTRFKADGSWQENLIELEQPILIKKMRLDPTELPISYIELNWIELLNAKGEVIKRFELNQSMEGWKLYNVDQEKSSEGKVRLIPQNSDPFIVSPEFKKIEVSAMRWQGKFVDIPSFWKWLVQPKIPLK